MRRTHIQIFFGLMAACLLVAACSGKLKREYDFRPYITAWMIENCGAKKQYNCSAANDWAGGGFDEEDYVYGLFYSTPEGQRRIVWVKVEAKKPHTRTVVGDEPASD